MSGPDLFGWSEEEDAQARVQAFKAARAQAADKVKVAPHGQVEARRQRLQALTLEALRADLALDRLKNGRRS
ncbi:hypothetical protein BH10PSE5_BH10PSE5_01440 [soil metagenome]